MCYCNPTEWLVCRRDTANSPLCPTNTLFTSSRQKRPYCTSSFLLSSPLLSSPLLSSPLLFSPLLSSPLLSSLSSMSLLNAPMSINVVVPFLKVDVFLWLSVRNSDNHSGDFSHLWKDPPHTHTHTQSHRNTQTLTHIRVCDGAVCSLLSPHLFLHQAALRGGLASALVSKHQLALCTPLSPSSSHFHFSSPPLLYLSCSPSFCPVVFISPNLPSHPPCSLQSIFARFQCCESPLY